MFFVDASGDFTLPFMLDDPQSGAALDADALPPFRVVHGDAGQVGFGTGALFESGVITGCTAATPAVVTSNAHGLATGCAVTVASVGGVSGVNGVRTVTVTGANTFSLDGTVGSGSYTSGGTWHTTGLYGFTFDGSLLAALEPGETYTVFVYPVVDGDTQVRSFTFTVK